MSQPAPLSNLPNEEQYARHLRGRNMVGFGGLAFFAFALIFCLIALLALGYNIINAAFGGVAESYRNPPDIITRQLLGPDAPPYEELNEEQVQLLVARYFQQRENANIMRGLLAEYTLGFPRTQTAGLRTLQEQTLGEAFALDEYPETIASIPFLPEFLGEEAFAQALTGKDAEIYNAPFTEVVFRDIPSEARTSVYSVLLYSTLGRDGFDIFFLAEVAQLRTIATYSLVTWLTDRKGVEADLQRRIEIARAEAEKRGEESTIENAQLTFRSWLDLNFLTRPMSQNPDLAGIRTAILGSIYVVVLTMLVALPLGTGAAIYLEEYAGRSFLNRIIQTNIDNLAGVPSIIYGLLGLGVFVRLLRDLTNGRSIISASLTLALVILPIIIINAQEAIRAVPSSLREASYGMGATKWQTVSRVVMPSALPGILTGSILAVSRAMGETAPLLLAGAATYIITDPISPFNRFTVITMQIFLWTGDPRDAFRNAAAAAIIVLLVILLSLNSFAIVLRNRLGKRRI